MSQALGPQQGRLANASGWLHGWNCETQTWSQMRNPVFKTSEWRNCVNCFDLKTLIVNDIKSVDLKCDRKAAKAADPRS